MHAIHHVRGTEATTLQHTQRLLEDAHVVLELLCILGRLLHQFRNEHHPVAHALLHVVARGLQNARRRRAGAAGEQVKFVSVDRVTQVDQAPVFFDREIHVVDLVQLHFERLGLLAHIGPMSGGACGDQYVPAHTPVGRLLRFEQQPALRIGGIEVLELQGRIGPQRTRGMRVGIDLEHLGHERANLGKALFMEGHARPEPCGKRWLRGVDAPRLLLDRRHVLGLEAQRKPIVLQRDRFGCGQCHRLKA